MNVKENIDEMDERHLRLLVDAAVSVLAEGFSEEERDRLVDLPSARAVSELSAILSEAGVSDADTVAAALMDEPVRDNASRRMIKEALAEPEVSAKITAAYDERTSMMVLDGGIITGPVLLAIVLLRLKRVQVNKKGLDIQLQDSKGVDALFTLIRGARGGL
ncbi:MAG: hypothetical protein ACLQDY_18870 [Streptosporangiaceae bacterium]